MSDFIFLWASLLLSLLLTTISALTSRELVDSIIEKKPIWTVVKDVAENVPLSDLRRPTGFLGLDPNPDNPLEEKKHKIYKSTIPEFFDAREQWPDCRDIISTIRDQGACGSCWAFAAAEVMSDRVCINTAENIRFKFSPEDLLQCCTQCTPSRNACDGGYIETAWTYFRNEGVVSGGDYNSKEGCKPYSKEAFIDGIANKCEESCQSNYSVSYYFDKRFGSNAYLVQSSVEQIQTEIMTYGPVIAGFEVYDDFFLYSSGIYQHVIGDFSGNHAIKLIGWGKENETDYWLAVNSWGPKWGINGSLKILRGKNHCNIEKIILAGHVGSSGKLLSSFVLLLHVATLFIYLI